MPSDTDPAVDLTARPALWTCPACGHRFVTANIWHSCSRHSVDELFLRSTPTVRTAFDRLVESYERCGPIAVIAQKTRIVFMVRVRFGGCVVRRDRLVASIALPQRVEHPRWRNVEEIVPGWVAHRLDVFDGSELADPDVKALICESYRLMGEQGRLKAGPSVELGPGQPRAEVQAAASVAAAGAEVTGSTRK